VQALASPVGIRHNVSKAANSTQSFKGGAIKGLLHTAMKILRDASVSRTHIKLQQGGVCRRTGRMHVHTVATALFPERKKRFRLLASHSGFIQPARPSRSTFYLAIYMIFEIIPHNNEHRRPNLARQVNRAASWTNRERQRDFPLGRPTERDRKRERERGEI